MPVTFHYDEEKNAVMTYPTGLLAIDDIELSRGRYALHRDIGNSRQIGSAWRGEILKGQSKSDRLANADHLTIQVSSETSTPGGATTSGILGPWWIT